MTGFFGHDGSDTLIGGGGRDRMAGGQGDDVYHVNGGGDIIREDARSGTDWVRSTVTLTLADNVENLKLQSQAGLSGAGNGLANKIIGNGAANRLDGFGKADFLVGLEGNDTMHGGLGDDSLIGNAGDDWMFGGAGNDTLRGDRSYSEEQHDRMYGGAGDAILWTDRGSDSLIGGSGADSFVFTESGIGIFITDPRDVYEIGDFSPEEGDRIDLSRLDADEDRSGRQHLVLVGGTKALNVGEGRFEDGILYGNTTGRRYGAEFILILHGVTSLSASDLIL